MTVPVQVRGEQGVLCRNAFVDDFKMQLSWIETMSCDDERDGSLRKHNSTHAERHTRAVVVLGSSKMVEPGIFELHFKMPHNAGV